MTDPWATRVDAKPPRQGISPAMIAVIATSVAVLAIVGATGGFLLANATPEASASPSSSLSASGPMPSSSGAGETPSSDPSATGSAATGILPPGVGTDFRPYFAQLRALKLGVVLIFGEPGEATMVTKTSPPAGDPIHPGLTIKVYVAGDPPATELPNVVGKPCRDARIPLGAVGLLPTYVSGQTGVVLGQSPDPQAGGTARWNDHVALTCGTATASPASG